jgi:hypothetical protein
MEENFNFQIEEKYKILLNKDFISKNHMEKNELLEKLHVSNYYLIILFIFK